MKPFMFVINSIPAPDNRYFGRIRRGIVHIWVFSDSVENAMEAAFSYIRRQHWTPVETEYAFEIPDALIPDLHKDEAALYRQARKYGIAADILASPVEEGNPGDPAILAPPY